MPSEVFVVGLSWRSAPVSVREKLAFHDDELEGCLQALLRQEHVEEAMILSTCNRVEIYGCTAKIAPASAVLQSVAGTRDFLARSRQMSSGKLSEVVYERIQEDAVRHIFSVASALDSMVVGESQILGQMKSSYGTALRNEAIGGTLGRCMEKAFGVAKRVRSETGISRGAANVSSVAVELAKRVFGDLAGKEVLIVGAGKMSALAARHLRADGAAKLRVINRSIEKAESLAAEIDGIARPWDDLEVELAKADVIISSTGARQPILSKKLMKKAMKKRRYKPCFVMDIAVPRDVEPEVGKLEGVYLFDIDDLERLVAENLKERSREAEAARVLVEGEVQGFERWLRQQQVVPTIRALREHFHSIALAEVERSLRTWAKDGDENKREQQLEQLAKGIANKLLHSPTTALKHASASDKLAESADELFGLSGAQEEKSERVSTAAPVESKKI